MELQIKNIGDVASLFTIVGVVFGIITIMFTAKQFKEAALARRLQLIQEIILQIGIEEIRDIRKQIYNAKRISELNIDKIRKIAVAYDRISFMLLYDVKSIKLFYEFQGDEIISLWDKISPSIKQIRIDRKNMNYCFHFEKLYKRMEKINKKKILHRKMIALFVK